MIFALSDAVGIVESFDPRGDGPGRKSRELTLQLLAHTRSPFSRRQFKPGHITCTALVAHPFEPWFLLMHHHRLGRWLLPGGHVEKDDPSLAFAAAREAHEETNVQLDPSFVPALAGIDVHGIPPKRDEPFHLHHDLIWRFRAASDGIETTDEAPEVRWAAESELDDLQVTESIRQCISRSAF